MNVHFIAWMSITFTFLLIGGGAYVADALYPHPFGLIDVWSHPGFTTTLARAFFFYGGIYAACNFVYHLFGLRRVRRDLARAKRRLAQGLGLAELVAASRAREGTGAANILRLDLDGDTAPHAFERALSPRVREVGSGARALATTAVLMFLAGLLAMVVECNNAARGMALTGAPYELQTLGWMAAAALEKLATGMLFGLTCAYAFFTLREGSREASKELERVVSATRDARWLFARS